MCPSVPIRAPQHTRIWKTSISVDAQAVGVGFTNDTGYTDHVILDDFLYVYIHISFFVHFLIVT